MRERPILMHARSINGILEGRKTQTRRIVKAPRGSDTGGNRWADKYPICKPDMMKDSWQVWFHGDETDRVGVSADCPYGQPGDRLWVRETWQQYRAPSEKQQAAITESIARIHAGESRDIVAEVLNWGRSDGEQKVLYAADFGEWAFSVDSDLKPWRPSIFMPRWASRLTLEIAGIRVERVQDISYQDTQAEGIVTVPREGQRGILASDGINEFQKLWDSTNGKGAWDRNDWCWVVDFKKIQQ